MKKVLVFCAILYIPVFAFAQSAISIDTALKQASTYLNSRLQKNSKVVVLNFTSDWPKLTDYIIEELIGYIVNDGTLTVVDRANLETVRKELNFQLSGEVSDETAQSIGKMLGAQTIISGGITAIGNTYRLRVRAISVQTAEVRGMQNVDVVHDSRVAALTGTSPAPVIQPTPTVAKAKIAKSVGGNLGIQSVTLTDNFKYGGNWQGHFMEPALFNGNKIGKGETYTLKITFTADRDVEQSIFVGLVDPSPSAKNWRPLSWISSKDLCDVGQEIKAPKKGEVVSVTLTFTTVNSSSGAKPNQNSLVFASRDVNDKKGPVTLNFTEFVFTKN